MKTDWDYWLQVGGFLFILAIALPVIGFLGGVLLRAGCYWVGVRMPRHLRAGLIFLVVSLAGGGLGYLVTYAASSLGTDIGLSSTATTIAALIISLPIHGLISMAAIVGFLRTTWKQGILIWLAQMAIVVALGGAIGILAEIMKLPIQYQLAILGAMILILAVLLRQGWVTLFGPVLFYDLVRIARRGRYILLRVAYALLLLLVLWTTYASFSDRFGSGAIPAQEVSKVASTYFVYFLISQLAVVILLTPAFTASAIAEEKERKTLEFLLATDLRNREIVLSKLASRYCNLGLLVLTGLPILGLTQFMGGVDPELVLAGFAITAVTMASLAALSILQSVYAKKPRDAIVLTYLGALTYIMLATSALILKVPAPGFAAIWGFGINLPFGGGILTVQDIVETFNAGNVIFVYIQLAIALSTGGKDWSDVLLSLLRNYSLFHLTVALGCAAVAVWKVRSVALLQTYGKPQKAAVRFRWLGRPACGKYPMIWKEVWAEPGIRLAWFGRIVMGILVGITMIPGIWILIYYAWDVLAGTWHRPQLRPSAGGPVADFLLELGQSMNIWVRICGTIVAIILLLAVAVRAATTVTAERDRQTMDSLLTTPLDSTSILFAKLLGSIMSVRWGWLWLALIWGLGLITTGLNVLALPLVIGAWIVLAFFVANLGLWFSASCRTSLRASIWTILTTLMCFGGHWLAWLCCIPFFFMGGGPPGKIFENVAEFQSFGLTPPVTLVWLAFHGEEFREMGNREEPLKFMAFSFFGLIFWSAASLGLWFLTCARFRTISGRASLRRRAAPTRLVRHVDKPASTVTQPAPATPANDDHEIALQSEFKDQESGIGLRPPSNS
jgi:ABC-type Na+ efflux pump permease subunit